MFRDPEGLWAVCTKCAIVEVPTAIANQAFEGAHCSVAIVNFSGRRSKKKKRKKKEPPDKQSAPHCVQVITPLHHAYSASFSRTPVIRENLRHLLGRAACEVGLRFDFSQFISLCMHSKGWGLREDLQKTTSQPNVCT